MSLENSKTTVDIKDHDDERCLVVVNLKRDLRIHVLRRLPARRLRLPLLVSLIADHVRVGDAKKVFGANHSNVKHAHRSRNVASILSFRLGQHLLRILQLLVVLQDLILDLPLALNQLVLGVYVEFRELVKVDAVVSIEVGLLKELVNNLNAVVLVDPLSSQVDVHFLAVNPAVFVFVDRVEFLP